MSSYGSEFVPLAVNPPFTDFADVDAPAAGASAYYTVPGEYSVAVVAARCLLTTDSNVANRFVSLDYIDGRGTTRARNAAALVVTASTTGQAFEWNTAYGWADWATGTPVLAPCLGYLLPPAYRVQITVDNVQAGDQLSAVHLLLIKVETGPERARAQHPQTFAHRR